MCNGHDVGHPARFCSSDGAHRAVGERNNFALQRGGGVPAQRAAESLLAAASERHVAAAHCDVYGVPLDELCMRVVKTARNLRSRDHLKRSAGARAWYHGVSGVLAVGSGCGLGGSLSLGGGFCAGDYSCSAPA